MARHTIIVATGPWDPEPWRAEFREFGKGRRIVFWPEDADERIAQPYVICSWKADPRLYRAFPKPTAVFSLGAGVDHLIGAGLSPNVPIARAIDPDLTMRMVE